MMAGRSVGRQSGAAALGGRDQGGGTTGWIKHFKVRKETISFVQQVPK
jgi:hypothetical protein